MPAARDKPRHGGDPYGPGCRGQDGTEAQRKAKLTAQGQRETEEDRASCLVPAGQQGWGGKAEAWAGVVRGQWAGRGRALLIWDAGAGCAHVPVVPALWYGARARGGTQLKAVWMGQQSGAGVLVGPLWRWAWWG